MKNKYDIQLESLKSSSNEINNKQQELKNVVCERISCENKFSLDNVINYMNSSISKSNSEKHRIMNDFISKRIGFNEFVQAYKQPSIQYHTQNILKEKLYQVKVHSEQEGNSY